MSFDLKDSGQRQEFPTGARRDLQEGKGRPDLISTIFLQRLAVVLERGAGKYGDRNWEKGMPLSRHYSSALRHLMQAFEGRTDEDHLGQAAFNVMAFLHTQEMVKRGLLDPGLDDLPRLENQEACIEAWSMESIDPDRLMDEPASITIAEMNEARSMAAPWDELTLEEKVREHETGQIKGHDGVWRPRAAPEGTKIVPPLCWGGSDQENPDVKYGETGELT